MSGSAGVWPMAPAANPAKPTPSFINMSKRGCWNELGTLLPVHIDEHCEKELDSVLVGALTQVAVVAHPLPSFPNRRFPGPHSIPLSRLLHHTKLGVS